jgi:hypothetical protein
MVFLEFRPIQAPKRSYKLGVQWADAEVTRGREDGRGEQITDSELHNPSTGPFVPFLGLENGCLRGVPRAPKNAKA